MIGNATRPVVDAYSPFHSAPYFPDAIFLALSSKTFLTAGLAFSFVIHAW